MKILALDLSTTATGYALFDNGLLIRSGTFRPLHSLDWDERALTVAQWIKDFDYDIAVIEDVPLQKNGLSTLMKLAVLQGMVRKQVADDGKKIYLFNPTRWRSIVGIKTFHQKRDQLKQAAVDKVNKTYDLQLEYKDNNQAESILIGESYLRLKGVDLYE